MRHLFVGVIFLFTLLFITGCNPQGGSSDVEIVTEGIFDPVTFRVVGGDDLGTFSISNTPLPIEILITNNSKFPITNVNLTISTEVSAGIIFVPDPKGNSLFPGIGGTCSSVVNSGKTCSIKLHYKPSISGEFTQNLTLNYRNLVEEQVIEKSLTTIAGEPASLFFTSEVSNYSFGIVERTDLIKLHETLEIKNGGGLPARNLITTLNQTVGQAYKITSHNCPDTLWMGASCNLTFEFLPRNYGPSAPDGEAEDFHYSAQIVFDYIRTPSGKLGKLNAYLSTLSTSIRGRMTPSGAPSFEFDETVVGNRTSQKVKIINDGYKEAIIRQINIKNEDGSKLAICIETGGGYLSCRRPSDLSTTLELNEFPFLIKDLSNCMDSYDKMNYMRLPDGTLSEQLITVLGKPDIENNGEYCVFEMIFQPSLKFIDSGVLKDIRLSFEYDSTWKNRIDIRNDVNSSVYQYSVDSAPYLSMAQIQVNDAEYFNQIYPIPFDVGNNAHLLSLGRIALITQSKYGQKLKINFSNRGGVPAELVSLKDGAGNTLTDIPYNVTDYYRQTMQSCEAVDSNGICSITTILTPLSNDEGVPYTEDQRRNLMFDFNTPLNYKHFQLIYKDGALYNDDLSLRVPQVVDIWITAFLIEKGLLTFVDGGQGDFHYVLSQNTEYVHIILENIGTGTVPYITLDPSSAIDLTCDGAKANLTACPIEVIDSATPMGGAELDCFDVIYIRNIVDLAPPGGYVYPLITKPGLASTQTCSITLRAKLRGNDVIPKLYYDNNIYSEKYRDFQYDWFLNGESEKYWQKSVSNISNYFSVQYVDGDSGADPANGYYPQITGLGNWQKILGAELGKMHVKAGFRIPGSIVPEKPWPYLSSMIYRPPVPSISDAIANVGDGEWGDPVSYTGGLSPIYYSDAFTASGFYLNILGDVINNFNSNSLPDWTNEDYVFYGGTYPVTGKTYKFRHSLCNQGWSEVNLKSFTLNEDATLKLVASNSAAVMSSASLSAEGCRYIEYEFTPTVPSNRSLYYLDLTYTNGTKDGSGTEIIYDRKILIVVESEPLSVPLPVIKEEAIVVEYDVGTSTAIETPTGVITTVDNEYNVAPSAVGSRLKAIKGSNIYAKRKYYLKNIGVDPMRSIAIARVKSQYDLFDVSNNNIISFKNDLCSGVTLNQDETCTFELKYSPTISAADVKDYAISVRYELGDLGGIPRYISNLVAIRLEATEPALFDMEFVNPVNLSAIVQDAYGIELGDFFTTHIVLRDYPRTPKLVSNIVIMNNNDEKGSFLAQYREFIGNSTAHPPFSQDPVLVYNDGKKEIYLTRTCLYGDDELDGGIPDEKKGIAVSSASPCKLKALFYADVNEMGEDIIPIDTAIPLKYYNNERASIDNFYIYFSGFIEPNQCNDPSGFPILDIYSDDAGTVKFKLSAFTPENAEWGDIVRYRVFYSRFDSVLQNVFSTAGTVAYVDIDVFGDLQFEVNNLNHGTYYYFLPVAIRETPSGEEFISRSGIIPQKILVPPPGSFWNSDYNYVIDKYRSPIFSPGFVTKGDAENVCSIETLLLKDKGASIAISKLLIDSTVAGLISPLGFDGSDYFFEYMLHWTSDPPVDIAPIFGASYNPSTTAGANPEATMFYLKPCYDDGCRFLSKIVGGDGEDIPPGAVIYVDGDAMNAAARCFTDLN